jgi:acetylglutamate synthase
MKNALTEILKSFSEVDFQKFEDFVNSPYHNKIKNACKLLIVLKNNLDEFDKGAVTKEELWKKLSPSKKYNYGTVKNLFHELHKLAEKFLVIESFTQSESEQFKHLYISLFDRNQYSTLDLKDKFLDMYYSDNKNNKSNDALR